MRKLKKIIIGIIALVVASMFAFALYKSRMSVDQMTEIFDNTKGIGASLAPKIANDIHQEYFLFDKNIFLLIGGFIGTLIFSQFMIMKCMINGQCENFELHQGTRLGLGNKINLLKREQIGVTPIFVKDEIND